MFIVYSNQGMTLTTIQVISDLDKLKSNPLVTELENFSKIVYMYDCAAWMSW